MIAVVCLIVAAAAPAFAQQCRPPSGSDDLAVVYCDLSPLKDWPEFEFKVELQRLILRQHTCPLEVLAQDFNLYIEIPKEVGGDLAYSFRDVRFQFHWSDRIRGIQRGLSQQANQRQIYAAPPDRTVTLDALPQSEGDKSSEFQAPAALIEFVFIPRIRRRTSGADAEEFQIEIAPISAVPSRVLDQPFEGIDSRYPVDLRTQRQQLERIGVEFIDVMRQHLQSLGFPPRLEAGDAYTWKQLGYFELVLKERLAGRANQADEVPAEDLEQFEYIRQFRNFWKQVDERLAKLDKQQQKSLEGIFADDQPPRR